MSLGGRTLIGGVSTQGFAVYLCPRPPLPSRPGYTSYCKACFASPDGQQHLGRKIALWYPQPKTYMHPSHPPMYPQAWNKWFTKGPGRARKGAIRPRHPQAPPGLPPAGLRPPIAFVPPPPPPPVFSMANFRRQKKLAAWRVRKSKHALEIVK